MTRRGFTTSMALAALAAVPGTTGAAARPLASGENLWTVDYLANRVNGFDSATGEKLGSIRVGNYKAPPIEIVPNEAGTRAYTLNYASYSNVTALDLAKQQSIGVIDTLYQGLSGLALSPDGKRLYFIIGGRMLNVYDASTLKRVKEVDLHASSEGVRPSPDGKFLYISLPNKDEVLVLNTADWSTVAKISTKQGTEQAEPKRMSLSQDGKTLYTSNYSSNEIAVIDTESHEVTAHHPTGGHPGDSQLSPDGDTLYFRQPEDHELSIMDTTSGEVRDRLSFPAGLTTIALAPDGATLYVSTEDRTVVTVNTATLERKTLVKGNSAADVAVTPKK